MQASLITVGVVVLDRPPKPLYYSFLRNLIALCYSGAE